MLLLFSQNSNDSPQVRREIERAINKGIPIFPVRIEDAKPSRAMEYYISSHHWYDLFRGDYRKNIHRLCSIINNRIASDGAETDGGSETIEDSPKDDITRLSDSTDSRYSKSTIKRILSTLLVLLLVIVLVVLWQTDYLKDGKSTDDELMLADTDQSGVVVRSFSEPGKDLYCTDILSTVDGGYILVGKSCFAGGDLDDSVGGLGEVWVWKLDSLCTMQWQFRDTVELHNAHDINLYAQINMNTKVLSDSSVIGVYPSEQPDSLNHYLPAFHAAMLRPSCADSVGGGGSYNLVQIANNGEIVLERRFHMNSGNHNSIATSAIECSETEDTLYIILNQCNVLREYVPESGPPGIILSNASNRIVAQNEERALCTTYPEYRTLHGLVVAGSYAFTMVGYAAELLTRYHALPTGNIQQVWAKSLYLDEDDEATGISAEGASICGLFEANDRIFVVGTKIRGEMRQSGNDVFMASCALNGDMTEQYIFGGQRHDEAKDAYFDDSSNRVYVSGASFSETAGKAIARLYVIDVNGNLHFDSGTEIESGGAEYVDRRICVSRNGRIAFAANCPFESQAERPVFLAVHPSINAFSFEDEEFNMGSTEYLETWDHDAGRAFLQFDYMSGESSEQYFLHDTQRRLQALRPSGAFVLDHAIQGRPFSFALDVFMPLDNLGWFEMGLLDSIPDDYDGLCNARIITLFDKGSVISSGRIGHEVSMDELACFVGRDSGSLSRVFSASDSAWFNDGEWNRVIISIDTTSFETTVNNRLFCRGSVLPETNLVPYFAGNSNPGQVSGGDILVDTVHVEVYENTAN